MLCAVSGARVRNSGSKDRKVVNKSESLCELLGRSPGQIRQDLLRSVNCKALIYSIFGSSNWKQMEGAHVLCYISMLLSLL